MVGDRMGIILKHTLKNIIVKPLRTFVLILCIAVTAVSSYLVLDMNNSLSSAIMNYFTKMIGTADVNLTCANGIKAEDLEGLPEFESVNVSYKDETLTRREKEYYAYVFTETATIFTIDFESAYNMGIFPEMLSIADDEIAISKTFSEKYSYDIDDTITLHDKYNTPYEYKVVKILPEDNAFISKKECTGVVNSTAMNLLFAGEEQPVRRMFVDVKDNDKIEEFVDTIKENSPQITCLNLAGDKELQESISSITSIFLLIFIISFLLVIFITISLSNRIVTERMSVIGTLRSLGISSRVTTCVLLVENVIYGLVGAAIGTGLYTLMRNPILSSMVYLGDNETANFDSIPILTYVAVFVGAVLVECLTPIFVLTKAVKTPIRDIIFANKDTEYNLSRKQTIAGFILFITSFVTFFAGKTSMLVLAVSLISFVVAVAMLMPIILRGASKLLVKLFSKTKTPVARLASVEISSKKSTVSSAVLAATAVCLSISIFVFSIALSNSFSKSGYKSDVMVFGLYQEKYIYSFVEDIDGVSGVSYMYTDYDTLKLNGEEIDKNFDIIALPDKEFFDMIPDYPDVIEETDFVMNKKYADKYNIKKGDTVEFTFKSLGVFPITKQLTLSGYIDTENYNTSSPVIMINRDLFIDIYQDYPSEILVKCDNPEEVIDIIKNHIVDSGAMFFTQQTYYDYIMESAGTFTGILTFLIILGTLLTVIGTTGNQIIGFEGRKREYAVMYSTAMNKRQLKRLIFLENMISSGIAVVVSVASSVYLIKIIEIILYNIDMTVTVDESFGLYIGAGFVFWLILMLTCLSPVKALRKMNTATELKYE